jgi:hypothetical protein
MRRFLQHNLAIGIGGLVILVVTIGIGTQGPIPIADADITFINGTEQEHELTDWATGRFAAAGLELPELTVSYHSDTAACDGFIGIYRSGAGQLQICNRGNRRTEPRHTVLHELAHAWSFTTLSGDDIDRFNDHRGLRLWQGDEAWWQQGAEQLAEIVLWGVQDPSDPFRSVWTHTEGCDELAAAFRLVTGTEPLNDSGKYCLS